MTRKFSPEVYRKLTEELANREQNLRREIAEDIRAAKEFGDLSENAAYKDARDAEVFNESRIFHLKSILKLAQVVDDTGLVRDKVEVGVKVEVEKDGQKFEFQIVDTEEANSFQGKISNASPLGKALLGKQVGESVLVEAPKGEMTYKITKIT